MSRKGQNDAVWDSDASYRDPLPAKPVNTASESGMQVMLMDTPTVYFTDMNCKIGDSLLMKTERLVRAAGIGEIDMDRKFVALKIHFGEYGNLSYLRPNYAKVVADIVKENGGIPFLTEIGRAHV